MAIGDFGLGALVGGLAVAAITGMIILGIALYVYFALALQSIARKLKYPNPWFAWIPFLNVAMIFQLGGFHWGWIFLYLGTFIPIIGFLFSLALGVIAIVSFWRIFKKAGYGGGLSLLLLVPIARLIIIGVVAWEKKTYKK